jgi:hypothetical protein
MHWFRPTSLAILASTIALACAAEPATEGSAANMAQPIINGTPVTSENIGLVKLLTPTSGCSGTLITPEWVLTAQHCLPAEPVGMTVERTTTGEIRNAVQLIPWSTSNFTTDIGLVRVAEPFPIAVGADGYANPLWPFSVTDLVGRTVDCYGYGANAPDGSGWGTLRYGAIPVESYDTGTYYLRPNSLGQIQYYGDSGSGCFYTQDGRRYQVSVVSTVSTVIAGVEATADVRAWVDLHVHSQCDDGIQSGTETGIDCGGSCAACPPPATLSLTSQWDTGWCAEVVITNHTGSSTNSWTVDFDVNESSVYALWNAEFANTGSLYTATNLSWNGRIPATESVRFGLCADKVGADWQPELISATVQ